MASSTSKALVLITGANQGLGFAVAQQLVSSGKYHVLVSARNPSNAQAAVQQLQTEAVDKAAVTPITLDVTDDASVEAAAKSVKDQSGISTF
jgi:NAD(P)-dependent dehydrogenase (short-subunit alcohol dehydrogenase family)